jgi:RNA-directed DNA polymerase
VRKAQEYLKSGCNWVVDLDLEKFFDRVNHDKLMGQISSRIQDKRLLKLIRSFLQSGVMECGLVGPTVEGTPQGGPLSPLLSNIVLHELDLELEKRGHNFARYADDCNLYVRSRRAGERVKESVTQFIEKKLLLKVNQQKSAVDRPSRRKFLGFSFTGNRKRRIARESIARFKQTVRQLTRRTQGVDIESMVKRLSLYLGGWNGYYGLCETPSVLEGLQGWMRRRLRSFLWKQWKTSGNRFKQLTQRGVGIELAAQTVGSCHGPWRLACSPALGKALGNHYFRDLGLPDLKVKYS